MESEYDNVKSLVTPRFSVELQCNKVTQEYRVRYFSGRTEDVIPSTDLKDAMNTYDIVVMKAEGH